MAKKRIPAAKAPEPGPRKTVLTIKGTDEWRGWLEGLADFLRTPTSTIVDHALVKYAKEVGYKAEAPKR
jgi:hypothetical protein